MTALQVFVGYGYHAFRAAGWALFLAFIGAATLWFAPGLRGVKRGPWGPRQKLLLWLWCFGASLQKVLPVITFSQEFSDFFNDPKRERLHSWQHFLFGALVLCGWLLAGAVAAAFSGLIQLIGRTSCLRWSWSAVLI